jgi:acetylglutamate kinase
MTARTIVVKIGGRTLSSPGVLERLVEDVAGLGNHRIALVHGGGGEVTALAERLGIASEFADGVRMTGEQEMDVVDMVLAGLVNKRIARRFQRGGIPAAGICASDGGLLTGIPIRRPDGRPSRTGRVAGRDPDLLHHLLDGGYLAVIASTFADEGGSGLNLNADDAALEIATMLEADDLVFLSDVPGILRGTEVIPWLRTAEVEGEIEAGVIAGGMIPKVRSSVGALHAGVGTVIIGTYTESSSLEELLAGHSGTRIEQ